MKNKRTIVGIICVIAAIIGTIIWGAGSASAAVSCATKAEYNTVKMGDSLTIVRDKLGTKGRVFTAAPIVIVGDDGELLFEQTRLMNFRKCAKWGDTDRVWLKFTQPATSLNTNYYVTGLRR